MTLPELITPQEAAKFLKVSHQTVVRMVRNKIIPAYKFGAEFRKRVPVRIDKRDLLTWLAASKTT